MIIVSKDLLAQELEKLYQALDKKTSLEELKTIQIQATSKGLVLAARNRTASAQTTLDATATEEKYFGVSGGYFKEIVSKMDKGGDLEITLQGPHAVITDGRFTFRLNYYMDIPPLEDFRSLTWTPGVPSSIVHAFKRVYFPDTNEDINSRIKGVYVDKEFVVSTNRWVLNVARNNDLHIDKPIRISEESVKKMISVFTHNSLEGEYYTDPNTFILRSGEFLFRTLLLPDIYTDYHKLLPKKACHLCVMKKMELMAALKRALVLSTNNVVNFNVTKDKVTLSCSGKHGNSVDHLTCECNTTRVFKINGKFLLDSLSRLVEENVAVELRTPKADGSQAPLVITEEGFTSVIVPIQDI